MTSALVRCGWAGSDDPLMLDYHDRDWGVPVHDDRMHFEMLILEGAQAGLSWRTILGRRETYRVAFANFDPARVAKFGEADRERLLQTRGSSATARRSPRRCGTPRRSWRCSRARLVRRLRLGVRRRRAQAQRLPRALRAAPGDRAVEGAQQGPQGARVQLRWAHDLLRLHAVGRPRERPHAGLLPLRRGLNARPLVGAAAARMGRPRAAARRSPPSSCAGPRCTPACGLRIRGRRCAAAEFRPTHRTRNWGRCPQTPSRAPPCTRRRAVARPPAHSHRRATTRASGGGRPRGLSAPPSRRLRARGRRRASGGPGRRGASGRTRGGLRSR